MIYTAFLVLRHLFGPPYDDEAAVALGTLVGVGAVFLGMRVMFG